jgi:hypothetical protein
MTYSRQQIVEVFRRAGMDDIADAALAKKIIPQISRVEAG